MRQLLRYDPESGTLFWLPRTDPAFGAPKTLKIFNTVFAGKEAFTATSKGYRVGAILRVNYLAHRVIWAIVHGRWPAKGIDHINHDPSDNRIENLREADQQTNGRNMCRKRNNTSGRTGVHWLKDRLRWIAFIKVADRFKHLGYYDDFNEAVTARAAAECRYGFHPNHGAARAA